jgi:predicted RNase H-like HicB family nuclease
MSEIIFEVREDEMDGGFVAIALGHAIATQGVTLEELREMVRDAVHLVLTHFENDFAHEWAIAHGAGYGQGTI